MIMFVGSFLMPTFLIYTINCYQNSDVPPVLMSVLIKYETPLSI